MEMLDIWDEQGNKTGKIIERGKSMSEGEYFLIVDVWVLNESNEYLISKRTPNTEPEPSRWQPTTGCAIAGEDSISAALRETREELGIVLEEKNGKMVKRIKAWGKAIIDIWVFRQEINIDDVVMQPTETDDVMWASASDIQHLIESDKFLCNQRVPYIDELFRICE